MTQNPLLIRSRGASKGDVPQGREQRALRPKHKKSRTPQVWGATSSLGTTLLQDLKLYTKIRKLYGYGSKEEEKALAAPSFFIRKKPLG